MFNITKMLRYTAIAAVIFNALPAAAQFVDEAIYPDFTKTDTGPLNSQEAADLDPAKLAKMSQEDLDRLYARLTAGPIPDGFHHGTVIFAPSEALDRHNNFAGKMGIAMTPAQLKSLAEALWKGKVFYKQKEILRNKIAGAEHFPAKLFCGQSLLDARRESIIIDYAFTDTIEGYDASIDWLAGRDGVAVRDEIRMIRPGFYLGRAYIGKVFFLNFTLLKDGALDANATGPEACWTGLARR